jgi:hypothetical protein
MKLRKPSVTEVMKEVRKRDVSGPAAEKQRLTYYAQNENSPILQGEVSLFKIQKYMYKIWQVLHQMAVHDRIDIEYDPKKIPKFPIYDRQEDK